VATTETPSALRSLTDRLLGRLRHGLATQELLDRLARHGVVIYPYYIAVESRDPAAATRHDPRLALRWLTPQDAADIEAIRRHGPDVAHIRALLAVARCMGVFCDQQLAGYTWASHVRLPIPGSEGQALFALEPDESYLFDMYVAPQYRGLRLAGALRCRLYDELAAMGRPRFYSVTLAFNRSARQFKARLGASEAELRCYLHARLGRLPGLDFRLWRSGPPLRTQAVCLVPPIDAPHAND
jgi:GNAT superfamily N-acetyltransferase